MSNSCLSIRAGDGACKMEDGESLDGREVAWVALALEAS